MKRAIAIVVCLFFWSGAFYSNAAAKNISEQDGNDWVGWESFFKTYYITGFIAGSWLVVTQASLYLQLPSESFKKPVIFDIPLPQGVVVANFPPLGETLKKLAIVKTPVRQVREGLDTFYSDFSKRKITLVDAIYIVKMQIDGAPEEVVDAQVRWLRTSTSERERILDEYVSKVSQSGAEGEKGLPPPNPLEIKAKDGQIYRLWGPYLPHTE